MAQDLQRQMGWLHVVLLAWQQTKHATAINNVVTNRTAIWTTLMIQDQTYGHKGQGPRKSFLGLLPCLSYQIVHLLVHTHNGKVVF